jgi:uncharacterized membrane protein YdjX (TVP38/TMEM64 family)
MEDLGKPAVPPGAGTRRERAIRQRLWVRALLGLGLFVAFGAVLAWAARGGLTVEALRSRLVVFGPWAQLAYVAAFAVLQPLGPPGHLFILTAGLLWPKPEAFACALAGALSAQALSIGLYRTLLRRWAERRLPERVRRYESWLLRRPIIGVTCVRLVAFTGQLAALALALSRVRVWPLFVGTVLGLLPGIIIDIWLIDELRALWAWLSDS